MPDDTHLPATQTPIGDIATDVGAIGLPPSLRILLDGGFYDRVKQLAGVMSKAVGFTPAHLLGKPEACFAIINISLDAKLSPHFVARHTYQTPGGAIGYDGALVQAVLEASGKFMGAPIFEYHGDWSSVTGKFQTRQSDKGRDYMVRTWTDKDALGLGIVVRWFVRGEKHARVWPGEKEPFWLTQCFPLNSPLWATDPKTQIAYLAIRRFANQTSPGILGAAAHDYDEILDASDRAKDVTPPRPTRESHVIDIEQTPGPAKADDTGAETAVGHIDADDGAGSSSEVDAGPSGGGGSPAPTYEITEGDGVVYDTDLDEVENHLLEVFKTAQLNGPKAIEAAIENNEPTVSLIHKDGHHELANKLSIEIAQMRRSMQPQKPKRKRQRQRAIDAEMAERARLILLEENPADGPQAQSPAVVSPPTAALSPGAFSPAPPSETASLPLGEATRPSYALPMLTAEDGKPALYQWAHARLLPELRKAKTAEEVEGILKANREAITAYKQTLTPMGGVTFQKEIEAFGRALPGG